MQREQHRRPRRLVEVELERQVAELRNDLAHRRAAVGAPFLLGSIRCPPKERPGEELKLVYERRATSISASSGSQKARRAAGVASFGAA